MTKKIFIYLFVIASTIFFNSCYDTDVVKTSEEMCVEAQMKIFDQAKQGTKQREYFDTAFKNRDVYNAWAWRECMRK